MARKIQDWINDYVNSLLGERSASAIAREAQSEDEVMLMKAARRLKYHIKGEALKPRAEFLAGLEKDLRKELARTSPRVQNVERIRFWRLSWARALGGVAAAAAMVMLFLWARTGTMVPSAPLTAPDGAPAREALQEAARPAPSTAPKPAGPAALAPPAPAPPAIPKQPGRALAEVVAEAQTIFVGQVVEAPAPSQGEPAKREVRPSDQVGVTVSVERYLKGPLPGNRVTLQASSGTALSKGERVLVMARDTNGDGVLEVLDYPTTRSAFAAEDGAATDTKKLEPQGRLSLDELVSQVEALLVGRP